MQASSPVDLAPLLRMVLLGLLLALAPLAWVWWRHRAGAPAARLRALTLLTLFLSFDLVLFGAFTRLSDSGLGCPDWPGCYGSASPIGAREQILAAQTALPSGPVSHGKAWIEMLHRYLATAVGALIMLTVAASWWGRRHASPGSNTPSAWWATATLLWVCVQGAFGAFTVTMKLYPAVVTAHLLGGLLLLALLAVQAQMFEPRPLALGRPLLGGLCALAALGALQIALGGWVSTNYAVLACADFPTCQGSWWPPMDFSEGFTLRRALGSSGAGGYLPFGALTAIHFVHRLAALLLLPALAGAGWRLHANGSAAARRWAMALAAVGLWQLASGLSNVVLGWPMPAAIAHTAGAAALVVMLSVLITRALQATRAQRRSVSIGLRLA
jgi:heme a synthase